MEPRAEADAVNAAEGKQPEDECTQTVFPNLLEIIHDTGLFQKGQHFIHPLRRVRILPAALVGQCTILKDTHHVVVPNNATQYTAYMPLVLAHLLGYLVYVFRSDVLLQLFMIGPLDRSALAVRFLLCRGDVEPILADRRQN